jgi:cation diffusion facilitator family transporter
MTVVIAFLANIAVALAKTVAALITGSASMAAEAAHSWADVGNESFLLVADRRKKGGPNASHPLGYGREAYVWSMFAALGLFTAGGVVSVMRGIEELVNPEHGGDYTIAYIVLAVAFALESISFAQAFWRTRREAKQEDREIVEHAFVTSDPTLRAVFAEDSAALVGLAIATAGVGLHEITGSPVYDALGSILVGILLGVIGIVLVDRNRRFLIGQAAPEKMRRRVLDVLNSYDEVARVTKLMMEFMGPHQAFVVASIDLIGDDPEPEVAAKLREVEHRLERELGLVGEAVLTVSTVDEETIDA